VKAPVELLAKSAIGSRAITLERHLLDTEAAAARLFSPAQRWGRNFCGFFRLAEDQKERFLLHVRLAALLHDIGKANADFYDAVTTRGRTNQTLRHEHLSALVLHLPAVRAWLGQNPALDLDVITAAVLSHHLKASDGGDWKWCAPRSDPATVRLFLDHPEVGRVLDRVSQVAEVGPAPSLPFSAWSPAPPWEPAWRDGTQLAAKLRRATRKDHARRALLLAVKAGVIVADSVASGLVREGHAIDAWIDEVVHAANIGPSDIEQAILEPRAQEIRRKRGGFEYHRFQLGAAELGARALILAGCGSGKTLAAWKWAEAQSRRRPIGKVIFLYPTRGTATEGFRDYVSWAPESEAALVHGTARYELDALLQNPPDDDKRTGKHFGLTQDETRLFSLGLWSRRYFSATVDQFLSFMEHGYGGLCLLPVLADAAVIVDEVHSFDRHMFEDLVAFLSAFDVPVLCMTASLSASRRDELVATGLTAYPDPRRGDALVDLSRSEDHPRYSVERVATADAAYAEATRAYANGLRVLWVVNRVAVCQAHAERLRQQLGETVRCYHSRFLLDDRRKAHQQTVADFQQLGRPAVAVTTQVCEMSLDLDADVLITETAPPPSLVQRFGRANRHRVRGDDFRARLLVYAPDGPAPYTREDIQAGERFLAALGAGNVSQRHLAAALEQHALPEPAADGSARFLDAGYYAVPGALRDSDEFACPCVLDNNLDAFGKACRAHTPTDGFVVNVPRRCVLADDARPAWLPRHLRVAPGGHYSKFLGFDAERGETR
jgi:CRISPR-associated endonuclease/helicase Cas3